MYEKSRSAVSLVILAEEVLHNEDDVGRNPDEYYTLDQAYGGDATQTISKPWKGGGRQAGRQRRTG